MEDVLLRLICCVASAEVGTVWLAPANLHRLAPQDRSLSGDEGQARERLPERG